LQVYTTRYDGLREDTKDIQGGKKRKNGDTTGSGRASKKARV